MFEKITVREHNKYDPSRPLDIGLLLETMLFYQKTTVFCDGGHVLRQLVNQLGETNLSELVDRGTLEIVFAENLPAIFTENTPGKRALHLPVVMTNNSQGLDNQLQEIFVQKSGRSGAGRRQALRMRKRIVPFKYPESIQNDVATQLLDRDFVDSASKALLRTWIPELTNEDIAPTKFIVAQEETGLAVDTNLDFYTLNRLYHKRVPISHSSLTEAFFLTHIFDLETDLYHASRNLSEISSTAQKSELIDLRLRYLGERCRKSSGERTAFQQRVVPSMKTLREVFNEGKVDIESVLTVILAAEQFKSWLADRPLDADLISEYIKAISSQTFLEKLPTKAVRWSIFTGAGVLADVFLAAGVGTMAGVGLSFLDGVLVEGLGKGWKPNQFVEQKLLGLFKD